MGRHDSKNAKSLKSRHTPLSKAQSFELPAKMLCSLTATFLASSSSASLSVMVCYST